MNYFLLVVLFLFVSCNSICKTANLNSPSKTSNSIPKQSEIEITIKDIDTSSLDLFDIVHFYYKKRKNKGIIVKEKSSLTKYFSDEKKTVKLCDFWNFRFLMPNGDTLSHGGHFALNGLVLNGKEIVLDLGEDAVIPVFEICKQEY